MRILMLGHGGRNSQDRLHEIRLQGHYVDYHNIYPAATSFDHAINRRIASRLSIGPWIKKVNSNIVACARKWKGYDLIWLEKALYFTAETIEELRTITQTPVVHYTPDMHIAIQGTQHSKIFDRAIREYDVNITTKRFEVDAYREMGARHVLYIEKSVSHRHLKPTSSLNITKPIAIGFIGRREKHYMQHLLYLHKSGIRPFVAGPGWTSIVYRWSPAYRKINPKRPIYGYDYFTMLSQCKIGLGLLTKLGPEEVTARSIEIPASRTFLLAERTDKHMQLYDEGKDAEFFGCADELICKAKYYLNNPEARERIAISGYSRFLNSDCRLDRQMNKLIKTLRVLLSI